MNTKQIVRKIDPTKEELAYDELRQKVGLKFKLNELVYLESSYSDPYIVLPTTPFLVDAGLFQLKNRKSGKVILVDYRQIKPYDFLTRKCIDGIQDSI